MHLKSAQKTVRQLWMTLENWNSEVERGHRQEPGPNSSLHEMTCLSARLPGNQNWMAPVLVPRNVLLSLASQLVIPRSAKR